MNIDPNIWGPKLWESIDYIIMGLPDYPTEIQKEKIYNFFMVLQYLLPCEKCRENYKEHIRNHPLTNDILSSKNNLMLWIVTIHNEVNKTLNKPLFTYEDFLDKNTKRLSISTGETNYIYVLVVIMIILIIILIIILVYNRHYIMG